MADLASSPYFLLILFIAAFALPLVYLVWIRNSPRYGREPWPTVLKTFAWGAVFSVIIAIILSVVFILLLGQIQSLNDFFARRFQDPTTALGALVVAPIVEEAAKGVGATAGRRQTQSKTDGLVYGAAAGLGFSATENLVYALAALLGGLPLALGTGVGAELRRPLGIAIVGGLLLSQLLTLYTTPVVYLAFDRLAQRIARRRLPKQVDEQRALEAG